MYPVHVMSLNFTFDFRLHLTNRGCILGEFLPVQYEDNLENIERNRRAVNCNSLHMRTVSKYYSGNMLFLRLPFKRTWEKRRWWILGSYVRWKKVPRVPNFGSYCCDIIEGDNSSNRHEILFEQRYTWRLPSWESSMLRQSCRRSARWLPQIKSGLRVSPYQKGLKNEKCGPGSS